ncbi:MAG: hypothetical protein AVDCRST_MAG65-873, partial [uncultured Solirubrobacteraceae bacterium]
VRGSPEVRGLEGHAPRRRVGDRDGSGRDGRVRAPRRRPVDDQERDDRRDARPGDGGRARRASARPLRRSGPRARAATAGV